MFALRRGIALDLASGENVFVVLLLEGANERLAVSAPEGGQGPPVAARRRVARVGFDGAQVEIAGRRPLLRIAAKLVASQIQLVRSRAGWHVAREARAFIRGQRQRQGIDDTGRQFILDLKNVAECDLGRVCPHGNRVVQMTSGSKTLTGNTSISVDVRFSSADGCAIHVLGQTTKS